MAAVEITGGAMLAFGLVRFLKSLLYGIVPSDPVSFGVASMVLPAAALLASLLPPRYAASIEPVTLRDYQGVALKRKQGQDQFMMMRSFLACVLLSLIAFPSSLGRAAEAAPPGPAQLVLFDTDIGDDIDDVLALGLLLSSPEVKILGVTTAWGDTELRSRMLDRLLTETGRADIPVATGIVKHRAGEAAFSQRRWAERGPTRQHPAAVDFLLEQIREHPGQITLIAVAPLTNVAAAYTKSPETFRQLRRIVMMGGSVDRGYGDLGYEPARGPEPEYNILMDVSAAQTVFSAGVPISLMPLDSTQLKLDEVRRSILFTQSNPLTDALTLLYEQWSRVTNQQTPTVFDAMAATYAVRPELCPTTPIHLRVDDRGMTVRDPKAPLVDVCLNSDSDPFFRFFLPRLMHFGQESVEKR